MQHARKMFGLDRDNLICETCENDLSGSVVNCDGICGKKYHIKCLKMNAAVFKFYEETENMLFMCDDCKLDSIKAISNKLSKICSLFNIYDEQAKRNEASLEIIKQKVTELQNCIDEGNAEVKQKIDNASASGTTTALGSVKMSYAEKVKASKNNAVVIVKPKKSEQKSKETITEIKKKIDPSNLKIERVRNIAAGGVVLECANSNMSETLKNVATEKMGENYVVEIPKLRQPCIKIVDMTEKYDNDELLAKLKSQNNEIIGDAEMKVLHIGVSGKRWFNAIIEIDSVNFEKCMSIGRLNIGWERCRVFENLSFKMCYKCCGFNHKAKSCKNEIRCKKCAGNHDIKECKSEVNKCANCINAVEKLKINLDVNHSAYDRECRVLNRQKTMERRKIAYIQ